MELTAKEKITAANALRIAADLYAKDYELMRKIENNRLADQFKQQQFEANDLAEKLEEAIR